MTDVSVIGTGAMGSALVEVFAGTGAEVTVWNRTREKAEALAGNRVRVTESAADALAASPLAIIAVADQEQARALVGSPGVALDGTAVACVSFVTPGQARDLDAAVQAAGGRYLDLSIPAYPSQVRSGEGTYLISGDRTAYEAHRDRFDRIGSTTFVDGPPAAAFMSEMAVLLAYLPMAVGFLQGARICEQQHVPLDWFKERVLELYPFHIQTLLDRLPVSEDPSQVSVEASVDMWGAGAAEYTGALREMGIDTGMYDALHRLFAAASAAGAGEADWTVVARHSATS